MPEETEAAQSNVPDPGKRTSSLTTLILAAVVVALATVLVVIVLTPPDEPVSDGVENAFLPAAGASARETAAPEKAASQRTAGGPPLRQRVESTIRLPAVAVRLTVEQLQAEAEQVAQEVRQRHPKEPQALHVVALLESRFRRSGKAEELWKKCIELDPKQVAYYVNLAAIAMDRGNSQLAVDTLEKAIDAGLVTPDVQHHLAIALTKLGRCEEAEKVVQEALVAHPEASAYWTVLGQAQLKLGKAAEAETSLKKAVELGSRSASVYFALGNACARLNKKEEAAKYRKLFQELKTSQPLDKQNRYDVLVTADALQTTVTILCEAAAVYRDHGNSLETERLLLRALALSPASSTPCGMLADLYQKAGMLAEARVVRQRLTQLQPFQLLHYLMYAKLSEQLNEPEAAEATLKLALAVQPQAIEVYASLAQLYLQQGKAGQARWYAQEAVRRQPSAEGYQFLAITCEATGDEEAAKIATAAAAAMDKSAPQPP